MTEPDTLFRPAADSPGTAEAGTLTGRRACVVGAGFGGLALAIRLQSAGIAVTLVEAREKPGGRAFSWERDGFTFDGGPTTITDLGALKELWSITRNDMAEDVELIRVSPFVRFNWPDGTNFDYSNDIDSLNRSIALLDPVDVAGYQRFREFATTALRDVNGRLGNRALWDPRSLLGAAPTLARMQAWRSVYSTVSRFIENEKLRQALSFQCLMIGANPMHASAIHTMHHALEMDGGVWWARGGTNRLVAAMLRHFERLGGKVQMGDPVVRIHTIGSRATEVETQSGWKDRFNAVASNADLMHTYRDLLGHTKRGRDRARSLSRKSFSPSFFMVHFGLEGAWPGIQHHTVLFGPRFDGLLEDIFEHGVLPADQLIYLHHPTVTDPSLAPQGKSTFRAIIPVANMGKLTIDWDQVGPMLEKRILAEIGRRLIPDIGDRIVTKFSYAPKDFAMDLNAYLGSAFSLEPTRLQSGPMRAHNRDDVIGNLYLVGAGTHPGAGIPGVLASAKTTAGLMLKDLAVK